jgi:hypothetical protein
MHEDEDDDWGLEVEQRKLCPHYMENDFCDAANRG